MDRPALIVREEGQHTLDSEFPSMAPPVAPPAQGLVALARAATTLTDLLSARLQSAIQALGVVAATVEDEVRRLDAQVAPELPSTMLLHGCQTRRLIGEYEAFAEVYERVSSTLAAHVQALADTAATWAGTEPGILQTGQWLEDQQQMEALRSADDALAAIKLKADLYVANFERAALITAQAASLLLRQRYVAEAGRQLALLRQQAARVRTGGQLEEADALRAVMEQRAGAATPMPSLRWPEDPLGAPVLA